MKNFLDAAGEFKEAAIGVGKEVFAGVGKLMDVLPANVQNLFGSELTRPPSPLPPQSNEFKKLENYKSELLAFVQPFNREIDAYNKATSKVLKKEALDRMMAVIKYFDVHTPPQTLAQLDEFHDLKSDLFQQIKQAYAENGVHSMAKEGSPPIADILSNMSQEYADKLMEILLRKINNNSELKNNLKSLYPSDETTPEAHAWQKFLREHSIEFLGGGNSSNFKVSNPSNGSVNVLKVDNRLSMPRNVEQHLREKHSGILTTIDAERQVKGISPKDSSKISRTLLVTDFCPLGSLDSYSEKRMATQKYLTTSILIGQMAEAFKGIQDANCMFPDAKPANWLIDSNGRIRIADTKSFLFTENGIYKGNLEGEEKTYMLYTKGYLTTEMMPHIMDNTNSTPINSEKMHASHLGRNIYQCLTGEWPDSFDFNYPIFRTELGKEYRRLITKLTQDPPENRMSLDDAKKELQRLGMRSSSQYQKLMINYEGVTSDTSFDLKSFVDNQLVLVRPGQKKLSVCIETIDSLLSPLKTLSDRCDKLMDDISGVDIKGFKIKSIDELLNEKKDAIKNATSIEDLMTGLQRFESNLAEIFKANESIIKFQQLKNSIKSLKVGNNDQKMQDYLRECDEAIYQNGAIDLKALQQQIPRMEQVKQGLSKPENIEVGQIIKKYDEKKTEWFSVNMGTKARMIESAMASIPIEERANLLNSNTSEVKELFKALAWHRINPFAKHVDAKGDIVVSSSANTFKEFKNKFIDKKEEGPDVVASEQTKPKTP